MRKANDVQKILVWLDGSSEAVRAIDTAASLLGPRPAVVLTVAPAMTFAEGLAATGSVVPGDAFEHLNRAQALQRAEVGASHARRAGFDAEARATTASTTWRGIVDVADELDVSAIVIGSRSLAGFRELARGSVAHDVAAHARRPVLIVPPPPRRLVV